MMRTWADELRSPKYSHVERERRFLVDPVRMPALDMDHVRIADRYLCGTRLRLRRMTDSASGDVALKLAKKYPTDDVLARPMINAYLSVAEYDVLASLPADTVTKRRYPVPVGETIFSVDVFEDALAGLVLAEIEAPDDMTLSAVATPRWIIAEVSHDPRYQGGSLARMSAEDLVNLLGQF